VPQSAHEEQNGRIVPTTTITIAAPRGERGRHGFTSTRASPRAKAAPVDLTSVSPRRGQPGEDALRDRAVDAPTCRWPGAPSRTRGPVGGRAARRSPRGSALPPGEPIGLHLERRSGCSSAWLECCVWDAEVAGSNPATPTLASLAAIGLRPTARVADRPPASGPCGWHCSTRIRALSDAPGNRELSGDCRCLRRGLPGLRRVRVDQDGHDEQDGDRDGTLAQQAPRDRCRPGSPAPLERGPDHEVV